MANPSLTVDVNLNDAAFQRGIASVKTSVEKTSREFRALGRDISEVSRSMVFFGGAVTAAVGGAFAKASKDIPAFGEKLKEVSNSFQALANNVAIAASPSLDAFAKIVSGATRAISEFVKDHQVLVNQFIKYSAISLAIGTVGLAINMLIKSMTSFWKLGVSLITTLLNPMTYVILAVTAAVVGLAVAFAYLSDRFLGTNWINDTISLFNRLGNSIKKFHSDFVDGTKESTERAIDYWGKFAEGFKSNFNELSVSITTFGASIGSALESGLSTTFFDLFKGNVKDLKAVLISFSDDILRAFSKLLANEVLSAFFGNKEGGVSLFGKLGNLLGFGAGTSNQGSDVAKKNTDEVRRNTFQFKDLTANMKLFGRVKDEVIDKFRKFNRIEIRKGSGTPGLMAGGSGFGEGGGTPLSGIGSEIESALDPLASLNESLAVTTQFTSQIGAGFTAISAQIVGMGKTYVATQGVMVIASAVASALTVGIVAVAASAIAALWAPAAVLASIATLGGAAAIGVSAVTAAVGSAPGIASMGSAGGGGTPSLEFGAGAFGGEIPKMAEGGIVTRPTLALIGEAGPEAVVPLSGSKKGFGGSTTVDIHIDQAVLNSPSNMRDFVSMLKEELAR